MIGVGSRVVCIDDGVSSQNLFDTVNFLPNWVKKGEEYIVRFVYDNDGIVTGILLNGIVNPYTYIPLLKRYQEPAFALWRFRELASPIQKEEESENEGDILVEELVEKVLKK